MPDSEIHEGDGHGQRNAARFRQQARSTQPSLSSLPSSEWLLSGGLCRDGRCSGLTAIFFRIRSFCACPMFASQSALPPSLPPFLTPLLPSPSSLLLPPLPFPSLIQGPSMLSFNRLPPGRVTDLCDSVCPPAVRVCTSRPPCETCTLCTTQDTPGFLSLQLQWPLSLFFQTYPCSIPTLWGNFLLILCLGFSRLLLLPQLECEWVSLSLLLLTAFGRALCNY